MGWFLVKSCCLTFVIYLDAVLSRTKVRSGSFNASSFLQFERTFVVQSSSCSISCFPFVVCGFFSLYHVQMNFSSTPSISLYWTRILTPCEQEMSCDFSRDGLTDASLRKKLDHIESHRYVTTKNAWITTCEIPITHCFFITWNTVKYFKLWFRILLKVRQRFIEGSSKVHERFNEGSLKVLRRFFEGSSKVRRTF